jgi:DNA topoisomerase-1
MAAALPVAATALDEIDDPVASARAARLRYVTDDQPGIRRRKSGEDFVYLDSGGRQVEDEETIERIRKLAIPPAWTDVWICASPRGHLQATGRDARGRKQYRYHEKFREMRDAVKYGRMLQFAAALPKIRERVDRDLELSGMPKEKVLAVVVRLLEETRIRVGNEEYVKENQSYGLTTLRDRHVEVVGSNIRFHFKGKSGKTHKIRLNDRKLARIIKRIDEIPGQELFQYLDEDGERHTIESEDVNEYIREITGEDFSAKDFRTWAGTILAARYFREAAPLTGTAADKKAINATIRKVADELGNTLAVCKKCYIHPAVVTAYMAGALKPISLKVAEGEDPYALSAEEEDMLALLSNQAFQRAKKRRTRKAHPTAA